MAEWPPRGQQAILDKLSDWSAWYSGDRAALEGTAHRYGPIRSGFAQRTVERIYRRFWGGTLSASGPQIKLHVPLAADIARASADLLFAEPPAIKAKKPDPVPDTAPEEQPEEIRAALALAAATQDRLDKYTENGLIAVCAEAAETCAALGGVYLRVTWTTDDRRVFLSRVDADAAFPEFRWGRLQRVTFWRLLSEPEDKTSYRHLEIHELVQFGPNELPEGIIRHQLWKGTPSEQGQLVPLDEHEATASLATLIDYEGDAIRTHSPGLAVAYVPNVRPNAIWRNLPHGANLGAADVAQCEDLLDQLDKAYSSLMRDLDLARARITLPESWLQVGAPGQGAQFDADRDIYVTLQQPPTADTKPELFQPAIRVEEHLRVMQQLVEDILRHAGYSAATFGEDEDGNAATATEINARTGRSRQTRNRKLRHWQPALEELLRKLMAVDLWLGTQHPTFGFAEGVDPSLIEVVFPAPSMSQIELAQMVALWVQAQAASIELRVRTLHPDWDDDQVRIEVDALKAEQGAAVQDPEEFRPDGAQLDEEPREPSPFDQAEEQS